MQRDSRFFAGRGNGHEQGSYAIDSLEGALYTNGAPAAPTFDDSLIGRKHHEFPGPLNEIEFQPFDTCPKNFVIFDQTYSKSRVMFHPSLAHKLSSPNFNIYGTQAHEAGTSADRGYDYNEGYSSRFKEDTEEIDALLSSEEGEEDDVVSTARTPGYWDSNGDSSSCSSRGSKSKSSERKKERMKKMVRTLKGIIPGGDQMDTPAVLDEAVRYLKSLKVEVKKLGVHNNSDS
ncbi:transcription factor bHLH144-like [Typha latifolia]|uniref:transcription factor bHLH144-like n=1 Tax=Typha latifolia TaxID=4733 RepID=UPI003C2B2A3B